MFFYFVVLDVNECQIFASVCDNGECVNTVGSYTCRCSEGLKLEGSRCIGKLHRIAYYACGKSETGFDHCIS